MAVAGLVAISMVAAEATADTPRIRSLLGSLETTCAITESGGVWCWGEISRLGFGSSRPARLPSTTSFSDIEGSFGNACLLGFAGRIYCIGSDDFGVRPAGSSAAPEIRRKPSLLTRGPLVEALRFRDMSSTGVAVCAVADDGSLWCWGRNEQGVFGNGRESGDRVDVDSPSRVSSDVHFVDVEVGRKHACGLSDAGAAFCWGNNQRGQLGDGSTTDRFVPAPVSGGHRFRSISIGGVATCGVTLAGEGLCWGHNRQFGLGDGTQTNRLVPHPVSGDRRWKSIERFTSGACGLTEDGRAWCWGEGTEGMLGTGDIGQPGIADRHYLVARAPSPVVGNHVFSALTVGYDHACGLTTDSEIWCWGGNGAAQLGVPRSVVRHSGSPVRVQLP